MFSQRQAAQHSGPYAISADFCRIFENDMNRLYLLSYLLTGDQSTAEECFVRGLDSATRSNRVFREWAGSWARRTIIQNAIHMVHPRPLDGTTPDPRSQDPADEPVQVSAVVRLPAFERFVFVMTVLERYSHQECSLLLGCGREDIITARTRALRHIGEAADRLQDAKHFSELAVSHFAVSA